jgi:hypothetical protein
MTLPEVQVSLAPDGRAVIRPTGGARLRGIERALRPVGIRLELNGDS